MKDFVLKKPLLTTGKIICLDAISSCLNIFFTLNDPKLRGCDGTHKGALTSILFLFYCVVFPLLQRKKINKSPVCFTGWLFLLIT